MAYEIQGQSITLDTVTDLSAAQYLGVKVTAANTVGIVAASNDQSIGILQNKPNGSAANPRAAEVMLNGVSKAVAGAAITAGAALMFDTAGKVVTAATTGNRIIGVALETSTAANQIIAVALEQRGVV